MRTPARKAERTESSLERGCSRRGTRMQVGCRESRKFVGARPPAVEGSSVSVVPPPWHNARWPAGGVSGGNVVGHGRCGGTCVVRAAGSRDRRRDRVVRRAHAWRDGHTRRDVTCRTGRDGERAYARVAAGAPRCRGCRVSQSRARRREPRRPTARPRGGAPSFPDRYPAHARSTTTRMDHDTNGPPPRGR